MSALVKTKTWQYAWNLSNAVSGVTTTDHHDLLLQIKNALLAFGSSPWTVLGSSNGSVAALDGVDRWISISNIINGSVGNAHSWIVLKQAGISGNFQICIDMTSSDGQTMSVVVSPGAGFTGGTTLNRPTATDSYLSLNQDYWLAADGSRQYRAHVLQSTDGQCTRIFAYGGGVNIMFLLFDRAKDPVPSWTNPAIWYAAWRGFGGGANVNNINFDTMCGTGAVIHGIAPDGITPMPMIGTMEGLGGGTTANAVQNLLNAPNDLELSAGRTVHPFATVGLMHTVTTGMRGHHGGIQDLWYTSRALADLTGAPSSGTKDFIVLGDMIVPNNGTTVLVT